MFYSREVCCCCVVLCNFMVIGDEGEDLSFTMNRFVIHHVEVGH